MLTHPLRSLRRTPLFAFAAALTLALGIGAVAATFAIAYGVLLEPLPYGRPESLVSVGLDLRSSEMRRVPQPPAVYLTYKQSARQLEDIAVYRTGNANVGSPDGAVDPLRVTAAWVTASAIPLLEVRPVIGRSFAEDEDRAGGAEVAVISEGLWETYFASSPTAIGQTLVVNSVPRRIVGVMPRGFAFPSADAKLWLPARLDRDATGMGDFAYFGVARLARGATAKSAERELGAVLPRMSETHPRLRSGPSTASWLAETRPAPVVTPLREDMTSGIARMLWMVLAAGALVLVVALATVTNLMLIRADARGTELAVREALGASRLRIATHFLGESLLLAGVAGLAALGAAWGAIRALVAFGPADLPRLAELRLGPMTVLFVIGVSLVVAIVCTLVPTLRIRRGALSISLRDGGRGETAGRVRQRIRSSIAAVQIAVALVVLAGSVLLLRTFQRLNSEKPGFDATNVLTVWTQLPFARYNDSGSVAFYARLTESVRALPGVTAVGVASRVPLGRGEERELSFRRDDGRVFSLPIVATGSGHFAGLGIPLLAGADFAALGVQRNDGVILSQRAAQSIFEGAGPRDVVGRRVSLAPKGPTYTVLGVAGDVRDRDLATPPAPLVYMPQAVPSDLSVEPTARRTMALVVKVGGGVGAVSRSVRDVVRQIDPAVPVFDVEPMSDIVRRSTARLSFTMAVMGAAALITLLLGAIGLYGVMAYMVALRSRELGIRIALGADPRRVAEGVIRRALVVVAAGVGGGLLLYVGAVPFLKSFLYDVTPGDPVTLLGAVALLVGVAVLASWLPARRAAGVDPAVALRSD